MYPMLNIPFSSKKEANILRFTPPGFTSIIEVPFPGRQLPVCEKCKKNFKTREHCRNRECHTALPWSECFVCVSLDPSCTNEHNTLRSGPFMSRLIPPQPLCIPGEVNPETTLCGMCKDKNYTRVHCRVNKKHRQVPWNTVFITLSYDPNPHISEYGEVESSNRKRQPRNKKRKKGDTGANNVEYEVEEGYLPLEEMKTATKNFQETFDPPSLPDPPTVATTSYFETIPRSRTFLCTASQASISVLWLDYDISMHEAVSMPFRDGRFMGMFGYNNMQLPPPPPMGPGDWYHPFMPNNMFEGREGSYQYPPFRDNPPEHTFPVMIRDDHVTMDNRGYFHPEIMGVPRMMGRPNPAYFANPPGPLNFPRSSYPAGGVNMESRPFYGQGPRPTGDGMSPRPAGMTNPSPSHWNGNMPGSFWSGNSKLLPSNFPSFSGYPMEGSRGANDEGGSDDHGEEENTKGESMHL